MAKHYSMKDKFYEVFDADELAENVKNTISFYEDENKKLRKEILKTREEIKNEVKNEYEQENKNLQEQLKFSIASVCSKKELFAYNEFVKKHIPCRMSLKINGGRMPIIKQVGTGIGTCTELQCPICGEKKDITDTVMW